MSEIKACPFCGDTPIELDIREGSTFRWRIGYCPFCGASAGEERIDTMADDKDQAERDVRDKIIASWNRRTPSEPERGVREGWRPIETAPTMVSVLACEGDTVLIMEKETDGRWWEVPYVGGHGSGGWKPTHWQPLPDPPKTDGV